MGTRSARHLAAGVVTLGLCMCVPPLCYGQQKPAAADMIHVTVFHIKPDMGLEWENLVKEAVPSFKKAGVPWLAIWNTAIFGEKQYVSVSPIRDFAQYDGPHPLIKALGEAGGMRIFSAAMRYFSQPPHDYALRYHPDLSIAGSSNDPPGMAVITTLRVAPGKGQQFEDVVKSEVVPAMKKAEVQRYLVYSTVFGGDANEWTTVTGFRKFADLDAGPPLIRALGAEGAGKLSAKLGAFVVSINRSIARYRPELSYREEPAK